jgi:hypothetical protein
VTRRVVHGAGKLQASRLVSPLATRIEALLAAAGVRKRLHGAQAAPRMSARATTRPRDQAADGMSRPGAPGPGTPLGRLLAWRDFDVRVSEIHQAVTAMQQAITDPEKQLAKHH